MQRAGRQQNENDPPSPQSQADPSKAPMVARGLRFTLVVGATDVGSEAKARVLALLSYASLGQGRRRVYFIKSAHAQFVSSGKFSSFY